MAEVTTGAFAQRFPELAAAIGDDATSELLQVLERHELYAGQALIDEGNATDALFLVWDGELDVSMDTPDGPRKVGQVGRGSFLGEVSLLDPGPATATVTSEQGCVALRLDRERFDRLCTDRPALAAALVTELSRVMSARIDAARARLDEMDAGSGSPFAPTGSSAGLVEVHGALYEGGGR